MPTLKLPTGKTVSTVTVLRWRKFVGDAIVSGDVLLEAESDDGLMEVASSVAGGLKEILAPAGKTISAGAPLAVIEESATATQASPVAARQPVGNRTEPKAPAMSAKSSGNPANVTPVLMPKAGQSMEEGVIVTWRAKPGAAIKKGDIIFEVETDKATMEVEATDAGRLSRIVVPEGGSIAVLQPVAYLADNDADVDAYLAGQDGGQAAAPASTASAAPAAVVEKSNGSPAPTTDTGRVKASPAARKVAAERGVDLSAIAQGSGPGGRILSTDVPTSAPIVRPAAAPAVAAAAAAPQPAFASFGETPAGATRKKMSQMRKIIARNLTVSKTTIPHFYVSGKVNAGALMSFYKGQKVKYPVSLNDVVIMACAKTLMEFPAFRSRVDGDSILEFPSANIGMAVSLDEGLVVPVIMNAEKLSLEQTGVETKRIANLARTGKIEIMGLGVFTISNMGMFGVEEFTAIINPPEAAILAVAAVREDVIVKDGAMKAGQTMNLTLSVDHRVIDGTTGAQFLARLKALLENPIQLLA
jgi:pyruvate dehydrogenase E2 component (dihydrolipoamide acetyltransferase)